MLGVLLALPIALVAAAWTGALQPAALLDAGPITRFGLPIVDVLDDIAAAAAVGGLLLAAGLVPTRSTQRMALVVASCAGVAWTIAATAKLILTASNTMGLPLSDPGFAAGIEKFVTQLEGGVALSVVPIAAAIVVLVALASSTPTGAGWGLALSSVALAAAATLGHSASATGHHTAVVAMFVHLVGACAWIGPLIGMVALWALRAIDGRQLAVTLRRYSTVALWACVAVAISGVANGILRLNSVSDLGTKYGLLLLAKTIGFAVLIGCGAAHRRWVLRGPIRSVGAVFWRLAAVEIAMMGAVSGLAVALASSAPPNQGLPPANITAAWLITGYELPPAPNLANYFTQWWPDVLFGTLALAGLVVYWAWYLRLRRRGDHWPALRLASWTTAMVVFAWVTSGGPAVYGHILFSGHMLQHMLLAMVIPLFLVASAPITLALRALPTRHDQSRGPREWILTLVHSRWAQFFANPIVAACNFAGSMIVFYYTPAFEYSLRTSVGHAAMVIHFTLAGYLFANALVGIDPGVKRPTYPLRLVLLLATMAFHAFFGVTIMSSDNLFVADWFGWMGRPWGASALDDQIQGGEIAWGIGEIPTFLLAVFVAYGWAKSDERSARRRDRQADRAGDRELQDYNAMLAKLADTDEGKPASR
ncbi:putative copper resistance protein D [Rarobacter incanus]|uniref:Putative copper resistance protein D n=1 Tax=Rarobacter incanus TaxID=153494 RepID=A0A542SQB0_9MICO|nr:putative copper resistance protein D [Rarobacter incanus]